MSKQSDPHCEFCEGPATWIAVPQACQPQYGCRLSCDRHRHWVRRLITMDVGSGVYVREYHGCDLCEGPVTADRLPPAYAVPVCHRCLPPPEPLPVLKVGESQRRTAKRQRTGQSDSEHYLAGQGDGETTE